MPLRSICATIGLTASLIGSPALAQTVTKQAVAGIRNFARVDSTVACGGTITAEAMPEVKRMGFKAIVNLRMATEPGANVEQEAASAKAAGLNYVHIPFNSREPDPTQVDKFLETIIRSDVSPAYIHCGGGPRAAMMWMIKRLVVDKWETDKAMSEAVDLGLTVKSLKDFALGYAKTHAR
jgi:uncharacterized protein (TIGR01244 family)